jgi:hypothetical protein
MRVHMLICLKRLAYPWQHGQVQAISSGMRVYLEVHDFDIQTCSMRRTCTAVRTSKLFATWSPRSLETSSCSFLFSVLRRVTSLAMAGSQCIFFSSIMFECASAIASAASLLAFSTAAIKSAIYTRTPSAASPCCKHPTGACSVNTTLS